MGELTKGHNSAPISHNIYYATYALKAYQLTNSTLCGNVIGVEEPPPCPELPLMIIAALPFD